MKTVLISGGSGLLGKRLTELLQYQGYTVAHLSRKKKSNTSVRTYLWDIAKQEIESEAVETADYIIHLAGEGIVEKKWTTERKQAIIDSRVKSAELLYTAVSKANHKPLAFISASAIGIYGSAAPGKIFTEQDPAASDFAGLTSIAWEKAADSFENLMRTVKIRIGIVLSKNGGALPQLALPIKLFAGSPLGSGKQFVPWIHIDDVCAIFIKAIEDTNLTGAYNAVSPQETTQKEITEAIAKTLSRPLFLPNVPPFILKIILGERANLVLDGNRVSSKKICNEGYKFQFPELEDALKDIYR